MALAVSGYRMMPDSLPASVQKRFGIDPQTIYQVAMLEIKLGISRGRRQGGDRDRCYFIQRI